MPQEMMPLRDSESEAKNFAESRDGARGPTLHRVRAEIPCVGPYVPYVGSV